MSLESRLKELNITLPAVPNPAGDYVSAIRSGRQIMTAGMLPIKCGQVKYTGKLGLGLSIDEGQKAARLCALNVLAAAQKEAGSLDAIRRVLSLTVYVNGSSDFDASPVVANGASELMGEIFGEQGRHVRQAVTVACLPMNAAVELRGVFELHVSDEYSF